MRSTLPTPTPLRRAIDVIMQNEYPLKHKMAESLKEKPDLKHYKKIPVYVVEEHNDALQFIYSAIGGKKLPLEGTTLLHFDAHPDMLIDRKLKGEEARSGRKLLPLLQIENWIVPAAAAGHIGRVVWLRPPWASQLSDGTRHIHVGDDASTGLLRVDSKEPYYLSDALYSKDLVNARKFTLTVAELSDTNSEETVNELANQLEICQPYVLDVDLDFFSTGNPFLCLYKNINLYDRLEPIFGFNLPENDDTETIEKLKELRERQIEELEDLFQHLEHHGDLEGYTGEKSDLYNKVAELVPSILLEAKNLQEPPDWWAVYAGGCTRDQGGLPYHISSEEQIIKMVKNSFATLLRRLPRPVLITVARSTDDGYCPPHQVELIQSLVLDTLKEVYDTDDPSLYYLTGNTF